MALVRSAAGNTSNNNSASASSVMGGGGAGLQQHNTTTSGLGGYHGGSTGLGGGGLGGYGSTSGLGGMGGLGGMSGMGGMGGYGGRLGGGMYGGSSMYGGGLGGMGSSMYGGGLGSMYGGGMGSMYGGGMGGMYGGMGGMYGGMGGMGMMGGMGGMGMMGGMMQPSEWEQRGHMAFMMLTRVLEALGMLSHVVQSLLGASIQFMTSYVGLSQQYRQLNAPANGTTADGNWVILPPGTQQVLDERGDPLPISMIDDGRGGQVAAVPAQSPAAPGEAEHELHFMAPEPASVRLFRVVKRISLVIIAFVLLRKLVRWWQASPSSKVGGGVGGVASAILPMNW